MKTKLKILILEDSTSDAEIVQHLLLKEKTDCAFYLAVDKNTYLSALDVFRPDVILSDHSMPQFDSNEALGLARKFAPGIPFIMVTGSVSEEFAANIIKEGADDYILKDRLNRLPAAIDAAIKKREAETEKQEAKNKTIQSESNLRAIFENTSEGFLLLDKQGIVKAFNSKVTEYAFFIKEQHIQIGDQVLAFVEESTKAFFEKIIPRVLDGESVHYEKYYNKQGININWIEFSIMPVRENDAITGICITGKDITQKKMTEQEREFERNNLAALINNTRDLMWSVDTDFRLITSNNAFDEATRALYGEPMKRGGKVLIEQQGEERRAMLKKCYEMAFAGKSFTETILTDGRWGEMSFYPIYNADSIIGTACFHHDITQRRENEESLKLMEQEILLQKVQEQKKITRAMIKAQEKERNHLGQELHDNITQLLAGTKLYLSVAADKSAQVKELVAYPIELIGNSIDEIRILCSTLVTPIKNIDLKALITELLGRYDASTGIKSNFIYFISNNTLDDEFKLNIYRIIQEQLNNIFKHAEAKNIIVSVKEKDGRITIFITDDGKGFDVSSKRKGIGISNMINRVDSYNGKVIIESTKGEGSKVSIFIPV